MQLDIRSTSQTKKSDSDSKSMVNGLLFHMTQPTSRSIIKAIACSKPTISVVESDSTQKPPTPQLCLILNI